MTKNEHILEKYIIVGEFISKCFGENVEVILHDLRDIKHSGIKIFNNHVSGRSDGAPMTEFGLNLLKSEIFKSENFVMNYKGLTGGKILRSSTLFIKDDKGILIGMLCVNVDITKYIKMSEELKDLAYYGITKEELSKATAVADFPKSVKEMINTSMSSFLTKNDYDWKRLTKEEKLEVIKKLSNKGIFKLRGGISEISESLNISEPTIYRYLNIIKKNKS